VVRIEIDSTLFQSGRRLFRLRNRNQQNHRDGQNTQPKASSYSYSPSSRWLLARHLANTTYLLLQRSRTVYSALAFLRSPGHSLFSRQSMENDKSIGNRRWEHEVNNRIL
jgi:hypothetical protein